jgi:hypothetical protein
MRVYASLGKVKSAESKDLLLGALGTARRDTFDKSLEVARLMAQDKVMQNPSGTAGQSAFGKIATGAVIGQGVTLAIHSPVLAAMTVGAELSGPYAMAKLFTYEPYQRWLGQGMKIKPTDYMGLAAHIGRLSAIAAQATPEIREALSDYLAGLKLLNALPRGGTQTVPKEGPPTLLDRAKGAAKAMGLAPRSSADRGADSLIGPRG